MSRKSSSWQLYDSDRSGFTYRKCNLVRQRGLLIAPDEVDDLTPIRDVDPDWGNPRTNSDTTTAVSEPTVYTISAGTGVDVLGHSFDFSKDGGHQHKTMYVISDGGAVDVTADPQIVAGTDGHRLTLIGTSNTDTIRLDNGDGLSLRGASPFVLKDGDVITLVYNEDTTAWQEVSREKGGI
jgi:hypothetical protein